MGSCFRQSAGSFIALFDSWADRGDGTVPARIGRSPWVGHYFEDKSCEPNTPKEGIQSVSEPIARCAAGKSFRCPVIQQLLPRAGGMQTAHYETLRMLHGDCIHGDYNDVDYNDGDYNAAGDYNDGGRNNGDYRDGDYTDGGHRYCAQHGFFEQVLGRPFLLPGSPWLAGNIHSSV